MDFRLAVTVLPGSARSTIYELYGCTNELPSPSQFCFLSSTDCTSETGYEPWRETSSYVRLYRRSPAAISITTGTVPVVLAVIGRSTLKVLDAGLGMVRVAIDFPIVVFNSTGPSKSFHLMFIFAFTKSFGATNLGIETSILTGSWTVIALSENPKPVLSKATTTTRKRPSHSSV